MSGHMSIYLVPDIPDPADLRYQSASGGDARTGILAAGEHLLGQLANMPNEIASAELLFVFDPDGQGFDRQQRLQLYVRVWAFDDLTAKSLNQLIERGGLSIYYRFRRVDELPDNPIHFSAFCDIVRRQVLIEPLHGPEFNANVPSIYYTITPFSTNEDNDFLSLDRILDGVTEPVVISVRIQPTAVSQERQLMTSLMERLHNINHGCRLGEDDYTDSDYVGDGQRYSRHSRKIRPLTLRDPLSDEVLRLLGEVHKSLCQEPHLLFSIRIAAMTEATARLVGSAFAGCAFETGPYQTVVSGRGDVLFEATADFERQGELAAVPVYQHLLQSQDVHEYRGLLRLAQLATVDELKGAFRLPVASFSSPLCMRRNTDPPHEDPNEIVVLGFDEQGIEGNSNPLQRGIHLDLLNKHFALFGMPGTGKTTNNFNVLMQLRAKGTPFMVIETAKKEYRVIKMLKHHPLANLRRLAEELEIYTLGKEDGSVLRLNPLEIQAGIGRDAHIENLIDCFLAAMPTFPALPGILGEAMEDVYRAHPSPEAPPIIADLFAASMRVLARKAYSGEVHSNIEGALDVRLGGLTRRIAGNLFKCRRSIPSIEHLMSSYTLLEMDGLSRDQKCLIVLFLLNAIMERLQCIPSTNRLRYVVLIEESHNIFGRSAEARPSEEAPDPKAYVAEFISKMLVELRALGVGIILSDQHPKSLNAAAIKSTSTKLAFRQVQGEEREEIAESMLLTEVETLELARLKPGEAYLYKEGYFRPIRIKTPNLHTDLALPAPPADDELLASISTEQWFQTISLERVLTELAQFKEYLDEFEQARVTVIQRLVQLQQCCQYILEHLHSRNSKQRLSAVVREALRLRTRLVALHESFTRGPYATYLENGGLGTDDADVRAYAAHLDSRFKSVAEKGTNSVLGVIERLVRNYRIILQAGV